MKKFLGLNKMLVSVSILASAVMFPSCLDDDDNDYYNYTVPNALVTVKPLADNSFYMQLDDSTTLKPVNMKNAPYGEKEVRALANLSPIESSGREYDKEVHVNWIDSILTKPIAGDLGDKNDEFYGTDPVEIIDDWVTIAEDGYLTLRFRTKWGDRSKAHFVNLLMGKDAENPYEVEFRHNAFGDTYGETGDGLVAFKLDALPDTEGKTVKLTLKWKSFSGEKTAEFDYCTRKATPASGASIAAERSILKLK